MRTLAHVELVLGGARSGKSSLAEKLAFDGGKEVIYIATATAGDDEMAQRIEHHKAQRPAHWPVIEEPIEVAKVIAEYSAPNRCLLIDCLTLWLTNCLFSGHEALWPQQKQAMIKALNEAQGEVILVSNEVGLGVVPMGEVSRQFVDQSGWLHQDIAKIADRVVFVIAGLPQVLKGETL
ncbi:TPA: bifunctional adenosylcobinamide kinase/adenosylcobinamide-phosphate guanylyltransferase [Photobacterium damselae]